MSNGAKNTNKGKRYNAEEKQQILAYVAEINRKQKRGGQKAAAAKFGISPLTISTWIKAAGKGAKPAPAATAAPAEKAVTKVAKKAAKKAAKKVAKKAAKKAAKKSATGKRLGRPPGKATKKVATKKVAAKKVAAVAPVATGGFSSKLRELADLHDQIAKSESQLAAMKAQFAKLKGSL